MKYIFVAGAPGSKWSSVVKNIYWSPSVDQSDHSEQRTYAHHGAYNGATMHLGSYFDPGMEFGTWFDKLDCHTPKECEQEFDRPFVGTGVRIIKSHVFCYHIEFLKRSWPDCPVVMVYRNSQSCLEWWQHCGGFSIGYPDYTKYYQDLDFMQAEITRQNQAMMLCFDQGHAVLNNQELCAALNIEQPPAQYQQTYSAHDIQVKVY